MQGGVRELARQAAAAARAERAAKDEQAPLPPRKYRGVRKRYNRYAAEIWDPEASRRVFLGSFETPEEAAHAYDAAARNLQGRRAKPNFPEPSAREAAAREDDVSAAEVLANLAQVRLAREPAPLHSQQPRPQAPFFHWAPAPATAPRRQTTSPFQHAPAAFPYQRATAPFSQYFYHLDPAVVRATYGAPAFHRAPSMAGPYVSSPEPNEPMRNYPASSAQSSSDPASFDASQSSSAAARSFLPKPPIIECSEPVVGDNFTDADAH